MGVGMGRGRREGWEVVRVDEANGILFRKLEVERDGGVEEGVFGEDEEAESDD